MNEFEIAMHSREGEGHHLILRNLNAYQHTKSISRSSSPVPIMTIYNHALKFRHLVCFC